MSMNREAWLAHVSRHYIWPLLRDAGAVEPDGWQVSVGFPKGSRGGNKAIGQAWPSALSQQQYREVFIAPTLGAFDAVAVLIHEHIHVALDCKHGHKGPFKQIALKAGLTGKMTATVAGDDLRVKINSWLAEMPEYPHAIITPAERGSKGSRLLKATCPGCGSIIRLTKKIVDLGIPLCGTDGCDHYGQRLECAATGDSDGEGSSDE